jgi:XkdW protein
MSIKENVTFAIMIMYPQAIQNEDFVVKRNSEGQYISLWNYPSTMPTMKELEEVYYDYLKSSKIEVLNTKCNEEITKDFLSVSTGFIFEFDNHDQSNLSQQAILLLGDTSINSVSWKTKDAGIQTFTREQFFTIIKESETHKRSAIEKYWILKAQVEQANTIEEIEGIKWDS